MFKSMFFDWLFPFSKWALLGFAGEGEGGSGEEGDEGGGEGEEGAAGKGGDGEGEGSEGDPGDRGDGTVEDFSDPDFDADAWLEKRGGEESVAKEIRRKLQKANEYLAESKKRPPEPEKKPEMPKVPGVKKSVIEALMDHPKGKTIIEHLRSVKLQDRDIEAFVELSEIVSDAKVRQNTSRYADRLARQGLKETLSAIGEKPEYKFIVSKYGNEVESELKRLKVPNDYWDDSLTIEQALRSIWFEHQGEGDGKNGDRGKGAPKRFSEGSGSGGGQGSGGGVTDEEVRDYAASIGMMNEGMSRENYNIARKSLLAKKKAEAAKEAKE